MAFSWTILWCLSLGLAPLVCSATGDSHTSVASAGSTSLPGGGAVSPYSTSCCGSTKRRSPTRCLPMCSAPAAADGGPAPGQTHSSGSSSGSQTPAAPTPAPPACNAPLPDGDTVSRYRSLSSVEKGRRLIEAAKDGAAGEVRALLAAGADVGARGEYRATALHRAAAEGHADAASCLLAGGAEVGARNSWGSTPLHWAAFAGRAAVVRLLAAASADLNARRDDGRTPLHSAAAEGHSEAAAALLEAGADRGLRDDGGRSPLDLATNQQLRRLLAES